MFAFNRHWSASVRFPFPGIELAEDAVVSIVPLADGKVTATVPATAGADRVTAPDVSPLTTMLAIIFP
jgi:hypothetical protein